MVQQHASVNPLDNFALAVKGKIEGAFVDRMAWTAVQVTAD